MAAGHNDVQCTLYLYMIIIRVYTKVIIMHIYLYIIILLVSIYNYDTW